MKKITYICDICKKEIKNASYIQPQQITIRDFFQSNQFPNGKIVTHEVCDECVDKVKDFMKDIAGV